MACAPGYYDCLSHADGDNSFPPYIRGPEMNLPLTQPQYNDVRDVYENAGRPQYYMSNPESKCMTYLCVHQDGAGNQNNIFTSKGSHAEQNFMTAYKEQYAERSGTKKKREKLDMYITLAPCGSKGMNCATDLRKFAEDYNFQLNIKAAGPYYQNEKELQHLMASRHCSVKAFTRKDYRKLAEYLGTSLSDEWEQSPETKDRDKKTRSKLKEIRERNNNVDSLTADLGSMKL